MTEIDISLVDEIIETTGRARSSLIPALQQVQAKFNYLPDTALDRLCEVMDVTPADVTGVATFYNQFRREPAGKHFVKVCVGTACHVKGARRIVDALHRYLDIEPGGDTDRDRRFTIMEVACLGCCTLAPVAQIGGVTYGHLAPDTVGNMIEDFLHMEARRIKKEGVVGVGATGVETAEIRVGQGSCCIAGGCLDVRKSIEDVIEKDRLPVRVKPVGCVGMCHRTPMVEVVGKDGQATLYSKVKPEEAARIVRSHFKPVSPARRLHRVIDSAVEKLFTDEAWEPVTKYSLDRLMNSQVVQYLGRQKNLAMEHCGKCDPGDIDEYIHNDGFKALRICLEELTPEKVLERVRESGLRGRGGAGFPTGLKWERVRSAPGETKYIICNGDEGDPGAFMDRMILESFPFRVIEGMIIAAYVTGAGSGRIYIRAEYPLALERVKQAVRLCRERGFLGGKILNTDFSFDLEIAVGAGAFVCGEETGLIAAIEGKRGMPRMRPPFPAESGLNGKPTLVNNVETFALVPWIMRDNEKQFQALGTEHSRGTKTFALAGKIKRGGLIEVPMGITIREIVEEIGGGVEEGRRFKAVQVGGPSGGCIPASLGDTPVDYEALLGVGAMMGSGGLVVLDDTDCMVDIARYFLTFTQHESCGKCTYCRIGTKRMLEILERLCNGCGREEDLKELEHLAGVVKEGSLCGLGRTAPNPVLSTLKYFRSEYEEHIKGRCPAGKCSALITYTISEDCIGCTLCAQKCPVEAIEFKPYHQHEIDSEKCVRCDTCRQVCQSNAVKITSP